MYPVLLCVYVDNTNFLFYLVCIYMSNTNLTFYCIYIYIGIKDTIHLWFISNLFAKTTGGLQHVLLLARLCSWSTVSDISMWERNVHFVLRIWLTFRTILISHCYLLTLKYCPWNLCRWNIFHTTFASQAVHYRQIFMNPHYQI